MKAIGILARVLAAALLAAACGGPAQPQRAYLLVFDERDPGVPGFTTVRMVVTDRYVRIDESVSDKEFVLFDRRARTIYNVSEEDGTILVVEPMPVELEPPKRFAHSVKRLGPVVRAGLEGTTVTRLQLRTNGRTCYELEAADILKAPLQALREYYKVLAGEQAAAAARAPLEHRSACRLANNVFLPVRHLEYGFPVRLEDAEGHIRVLRSWRDDFVPEPGLFELPRGYTRYRITDVRKAEARKQVTSGE